MSQLVALKSASTLAELATLLNYTHSSIAYVLYGMKDAAKYTEFEIPKRYGGTRSIAAPCVELKLLQRKIADLLQNCAQEINAANNFADQIAHGFKRERSIKSNAKIHRNRRYVFNLDLADFFGSINFGRVRGYLIKDSHFSLNPKVATAIAKAACHNNALPQGSPCSPVISNLIGHILDIHLVALASKNGCTYSRYADDLTFSTNKREFPSLIAKRDARSNEWIPGDGLVALIAKCDFRINPAKTRMQYRDSRQEVTGLVVNKKLNVTNEYRRTVRAMVHSLFTMGSFQFTHKTTNHNGDATINSVPGTIDQLHGMLGFIDGVDLDNKRQEKKKSANQKTSLTTKETMYRRFLLFRLFHVAQYPVLICEGKTDTVHMVHAIRSLAREFPQLATVQSDGTIKLLIRIFKYSEKSTGRILGLESGGCGNLKNFIPMYKSEVIKFKAPGGKHPVIVLIDNDSGGSAVLNTVKSLTGYKSPVNEAEFVQVNSSLYVVPTPLTLGGEGTAIEDFFDDATLSTTIGGKSFSTAENYDPNTHYGKADFAYKVVRPKADSIDFSGFKPILKRICAVLDSHNAPPPLLQ